MVNPDPWHMLSARFGTMENPFTAFITILDMALYSTLIYNVGKARRKYKVAPPNDDGPAEFQRIYRVQINTTEQLLYHLPLLWIACMAVSDSFAAAFGAVWLLGRVLYAYGYYQNPKRRFKGFVIGLVVNVILTIAGLAGVIASF